MRPRKAYGYTSYDSSGILDIYNIRSRKSEVLADDPTMRVMIVPTPIKRKKTRKRS